VGGNAYRDTALGCCCKVNVVAADGEVGDRLQLRSAVEQLAVNAVGL